MNPPQYRYQRLRTRACNYFSPLQQNDDEEENIETSPSHHPNITFDHNQTLLKALKASNHNYHWAPLYLTNDLEITTWNNNQKQDEKMSLPLINDATSCVPSSQLKTIISHQIAVPYGTNHHMLPSQTPSKSPHQTYMLKATPSKSPQKFKRKNQCNIHQIFWTTQPSKPNAMLLDWPICPHQRESRNWEQCTTMESHSHWPHQQQTIQW